MFWPRAGFASCARFVVDSGKNTYAYSAHSAAPTIVSQRPYTTCCSSRELSDGRSCFDIEVTRDTDGWMIRIPEIGGVARASRRAAVESAARECIATRTGIPIGYVAIFVASEIG